MRIIVHHHTADADKFDEDKHKRDAKGEFSRVQGTKRQEAAKAKAGTATQVLARRDAAKVARRPATEGKALWQSYRHGEPLPPHFGNFKFPAGYQDIQVNLDPQAAMMARYRDSKGRGKRMYTDAYSLRKAQAKYARVRHMNEQYDNIHSQNEHLRASPHARTAEAADATALIMHMGIRPGSDADTKAKVKAYGATTLEGRHVVVSGDEVRLQYTGKKGVALNLLVDDPGIATMLRQRKATVGSDGKLFGVTDVQLRDHVRNLGSGDFTPKDLRTLRATHAAHHAMRDMPAPTTPKEYKASVMQVAQAVSAKLGNTPTIALQSYIDPMIFGDWKADAGVK